VRTIGKKMKRSIVKNGDVLAVPLDKYMPGYGYVKYIDAIKVFRGAVNLPSILRVYNHFSDTPEQDPTSINRQLLMAPVAMSGKSGAHKFGWQVVGREQISQEEKFLPHVKAGWPPLLPVPDRWSYFEDLGNTYKHHFAEYENVKHLEMNRLLNINQVAFRIVMEKLRIEGKSIKEFLTKMDYAEEAEYEISHDLPIYSQLPEHLKGRAIRSA
jgi:hypothetical protein